MAKKSKYSKEKSKMSIVLRLIWIVVGLVMIVVLVEGFLLINRVSYYFP